VNRMFPFSTCGPERFWIMIPMRSGILFFGSWDRLGQFFVWQVLNIARDFDSLRPNSSVLSVQVSRSSGYWRGTRRDWIWDDMG